MTEEARIKYQNLGQVGAMGDNARVEVLNQTQGVALNFNFSALLEQLKELREGVNGDSHATQDEKDEAIVVIQNAKAAANDQNEAGVVSSFKKSGKWLLGVAERLGIQLVAGLIRDHIQAGH